MYYVLSNVESSRKYSTIKKSGFGSHDLSKYAQNWIYLVPVQEGLKERKYIIILWLQYDCIITIWLYYYIMITIWLYYYIMITIWSKFCTCTCVKFTYWITYESEYRLEHEEGKIICASWNGPIHRRFHPFSVWWLAASPEVAMLACVYAVLLIGIFVC